MAQILLGGKTAGSNINAGTELDPMFTELYAGIGAAPIAGPSVGYTLQATDAFGFLAMSGCTIPASVFTARQWVDLHNNTGPGSITLTQGSGLTLRLAGTATTGNRTLAQRGVCRIYFISPTEALALNFGGLT